MAHLEQSIDINMDTQAAYRILQQFERYPSFIRDLAQVRQADDGRLECHVRTPEEAVRWEVEITERIPGRSISWCKDEGPHVEGCISVDAQEQDGTRLTVSLDIDLHDDPAAMQQDVERVIGDRIAEDLARFKKLAEGMSAPAPSPEAGTMQQGSDRHVESPVESGGAAAQTDGSSIGKLVGQTESERREASASTDEAGESEAGPVQGVFRPNAMPHAMPLLPQLFQAWDEPFAMMRRMSEEMDRMIEKFIRFTPYWTAWHQPPVSNWVPVVEVVQAQDKVTISAELPGVQREDIRVEIGNKRVTIEGERRQQPDDTRLVQHRSERSYGYFYRVITLPDGANTDGASAAIRNGVLEITVPMLNDVRGRRLHIRPQ